MSSTLFGDKRLLATWDSLPKEIRLLVWGTLIQSGCELSRLATVSREWQKYFERHNFARIRLTASRVADFDAMANRNRALVRYIWLCLELDSYDCTWCAPTRGMLTDDQLEVAFSVSDTDHCPITTTFQKLFSTLSTWDPSGDLTLDISIYSPSDSQHWFKYLTFFPDPGGCGVEPITLNKAFHDPQHGWVSGFRHAAPPDKAILKLFHSVMGEGPFDSEEEEHQWWDQLPSVPAVTSVLLRQQNRRRWKPGALAHMFSRFPRLQEIHYEPWREWDFMQMETDQGYESLFESIQQRNISLKRLVVFENFNQQYPAIMQRFLDGEDLAQCYSTRKPASAVSRMIALSSLKLEHLAASFIVDARQFFQTERSWQWPNLTSLALTSKLLTPSEKASEIEAMLQAAAAAAIKMPQLETMEIWNGRKGLAALFKYHASHDRRRATITWRGTWGLTLEPSVIQAWEKVVHQRDGWELDLVHERLDASVINSHGDAIRYLMLSSQVVRSISLEQIQAEQKALEGVMTV